MAKFYYGGQAIIEGVMMRGRKTVAAAVRRPDNSIYLYEEALTPKLYQNPVFRLPFLRGLLLLWEMLVLGTRILMLSANVVAGSVESEAAATTPETVPAQQEEDAVNVAPTEAPRLLGGASMILMVVVSLAFGIAIFFVSPLLLAQLLSHTIGKSWLTLLLEGLIRLILLVGYISVVGLLPDVRRVYGYHGAEHKAVNALEQGDPLDVEHVRRASRFHTRCGTGFLLIVVVISIVVFSLISSPSLLLQILGRVFLVPVIAAVAYELMRLGAANYRYRVVRWLIAPSLALQGLTTREPDDSMIECAIAALQRVVDVDQEEAQAVASEERQLVADLEVSPQ